LASPGEMRKQAMFNRIIFGTVRRIMGNANFNTDLILSFLGLGVPRPLPSWGTMLSESQTYIFTAWWMPVFPGVTITLLVMSINFTGDWLRDRLDPTRRQL
jgi:ABC-type dipeptide/oligopeptide/nickel transport system permease subunit